MHSELSSCNPAYVRPALPPPKDAASSSGGQSNIIGGNGGAQMSLKSSSLEAGLASRSSPRAVAGTPGAIAAADVGEKRKSKILIHVFSLLLLLAVICLSL